MTELTCFDIEQKIRYLIATEIANDPEQNPEGLPLGVILENISHLEITDEIKASYGYDHINLVPSNLNPQAIL